MPKSSEIKAFLGLLRSGGESAPFPKGLPAAVIDTNVLMDFWHFRDPQALPLLALLEAGAFTAVRDEDTENEFAEVLGRPQFGEPLERQKEILGRWHRLARPAPGRARSPFGCRDPLDQKLFDLAEAAGASLIITKDRLVLKAGRKTARAGLRILTPAQAVEALGETQG
ncbi:PIN domain-containing protein [Mesosutterella sp. OilRF-GAM-744-9]|uniref:PIN domain-containing protein n=1 Tax=Mesosutterella porci TaxID=2915351 RepID=A0ABS9MQK0_9BURK|nr:PIN domain-containing protein [Mesosutterella sp. oilRF-744-WT-GAM-9]MCG5030869.1 PIN domain-containing protein [Mesosutterella sp. oilRF-744-WT-GAM-9]MCI6530877.1 PIN domain-containing protein [Mesosutterella sp.]